MSVQFLSLKEAAVELFGKSETQQEENEKYIKLLCLTDKGLQVHRVFEPHPKGKLLRKLKIAKGDLDHFRGKQ